MLLERGFEGLGRRFGDWPACRTSAVVDQDVNLALGCDGLRLVSDFGRVHEVRHRYMMARSWQGRECLLQPFFVSCHQRHGGPKPGQLLRGGKPDALRGSAYQRMSPSQRQGQKLRFIHVAKGRPVLTLPS